MLISGVFTTKTNVRYFTGRMEVPKQCPDGSLRPQKLRYHIFVIFRFTENVQKCIYINLCVH